MKLYTSLLSYYGFLLNPFRLPPNQATTIWLMSVGYMPDGASLVWKLEPMGIRGYALTVSRVSNPIKLEPHILIHPANWELYRKDKGVEPIVEVTRAFCIHLSLYEEALSSDTLIPVSISTQPSQNPVKQARSEFGIHIDTAHFYPVSVPLPGYMQHPLEGIWKASYGPHGVEIMHIQLKSLDELLQCTWDNRVSPEAQATATYQTMPLPQREPLGTTASLAHAPLARRGYCLVAHKLLGDRNIFSDTDSFVIFADQYCEHYPYPTVMRRLFPMTFSQEVVERVYPACGRIAETNMQNASWIHLECIITSNPDQFTIWWRDLHHYSTFIRVPPEEYCNFQQPNPL